MSLVTWLRKLLYWKRDDSTSHKQKEVEGEKEEET
jgi:hypothetical protein